MKNRFYRILFLASFLTCGAEACEYVIELYDMTGEKTVYRHLQDGTLYSVEGYERNGALKNKENFYWDKDLSGSLKVQGSCSENSSGDILSVSNYEYNNEGFLTNETQFFYENGNLQSNKVYSYSNEGCLLHDEKTLTLWEKISSFATWCNESLAAISNYMQPIKDSLSYSSYVETHVEPAVENVFGKGFLQFSGYYQQEHCSGTFKGEATKTGNVRITLINGILSLKSDLEETLVDISKSHGCNDVHYIFHATEGWTKDILNGSLVKFGYTSEHARMLAKLWIELIEEMNSIDGDGKIIHYAHSIGAIDTYAAQFLLTPEQRSMIHVVTIGSPTMIPNEGFASVVNYASRRDGVCLLDPLRFLRGLFNEDHNIIYLDTFLGFPIVDHPLSVKSYQELLQKLGKEFIEAHCPLLN